MFGFERVKNMARFEGRQDRGFSLIELLIVVSISLVMASMAAPQFRQSMIRYQMESRARSVQGLIVAAKREAARQSRRMALGLKFELTANGPASRLFVDANGDTLYTRGERFMFLPFSSGTMITFFETDIEKLPDPDYQDKILVDLSAAFTRALWFSPEGTMVIKKLGGGWQMDTKIRAVTVKRTAMPKQQRYTVTVTPAGGVRLWKQERVWAGGWQVVPNNDWEAL